MGSGLISPGVARIRRRASWRVRRGQPVGPPAVIGATCAPGPGRGGLPISVGAARPSTWRKVACRWPSRQPAGGSRRGAESSTAARGDVGGRSGAEQRLAGRGSTPAVSGQPRSSGVSGCSGLPSGQAERAVVTGPTPDLKSVRAARSARSQHRATGPHRRARAQGLGTSAGCRPEGRGRAGRTVTVRGASKGCARSPVPDAAGPIATTRTLKEIDEKWNGRRSGTDDARG